MDFSCWQTWSWANVLIFPPYLINLHNFAKYFVLNTLPKINWSIQSDFYLKLLSVDGVVLIVRRTPVLSTNPFHLTVCERSRLSQLSEFVVLEGVKDDWEFFSWKFFYLASFLSWKVKKRHLIFNRANLSGGRIYPHPRIWSAAIGCATVRYEWPNWKFKI